MPFQKPSTLKQILEPYIRPILGEYFNTGLLIIFGLIFALILYFIPKKYKLKSVLIASIVFVLISSSFVNFLVFVTIITLLYFCSNYEFKFNKIVFWITEALLLTSNMIIYRLFGYYSSFYSFAAYYTMYRSIHYFVDIRQGSLQKSKFIGYVCYIFFFPSFSHGPIERYENLKLEGIKKENIFFGFKRIFLGISKYLFLIYVLSEIKPVQFSFNNIWQWLILTAYADAIKLYVLFSGDIDIVIGIAALVGFKLSENFPKFPYIQFTLTKFWQNWQATIVNWLTAYVYFPLCRNRKNVYLKTMIVIMIIGWGHLFYTPEIIQFKDFSHLINFILYYTLWGIFLGGTLALSKILEKKKSENKDYINKKYPQIARVVYGDNAFTNSIAVFITFNIIAIGWKSPLYILIKQLI